MEATTSSRGARTLSVLALLATAVASGAFVGLVAAVFIWTVERLTELVWHDLPDRFGVDPSDAWWIVAVPAVGGLLVGLCQMLIGDHPRPLDEAVRTWRAGGRIEPSAAPRTAVNSLVVLAMGGPVGFEAALIGLLGGTASFVADRLRTVGSLVRQAWGAERIESLPSALARVPYWLTAIASVLVYRWLPFGALDLGFRFDRFTKELGIGETFGIVGTAAVVTLPVAYALVAVARAERATVFRRSPIVAGAAGGLLFGLLATGNAAVLFSGQLDFAGLATRDTRALLYITVAKFAALLIALVAGWRGGPIFPMFTCAGAFAVVVADVIGVDADLLMIAAVAAVSTVIAKGSLPLAVVLTVYVVPLTHVFVIMLGCLGAVIVLAVARAAEILPAPPDAAGEDGRSAAGVDTA